MIINDTSLASGECFSELQLFTEQNQLFLHYDLDNVRSSVGRIFKPHELSAVRTGETVAASMHHVVRGACHWGAWSMRRRSISTQGGLRISTWSRSPSTVARPSSAKAWSSNPLPW